jgi:hypothetical protein
VQVAQRRGETPVRGSMSTWPKNWLPPLGGWFGKSAALTNSTLGPNVGSSGFGPNVPALTGPATSSQNGSKSVKAARDGS